MTPSQSKIKTSTPLRRSSLGSDNRSTLAMESCETEGLVLLENDADLAAKAGERAGVPKADAAMGAVAATARAAKDSFIVTFVRC